MWARRRIPTALLPGLCGLLDVPTLARIAFRKEEHAFRIPERRRAVADTLDMRAAVAECVTALQGQEVALPGSLPGLDWSLRFNDPIVTLRSGWSTSARPCSPQWAPASAAKPRSCNGAA